MSVFSEFLASEISACFHTAKSPRIIVTELTASSSRSLHAQLLRSNVNSYLVVESGSNEINEEKRIISYKSLVSVRNDEAGWVFLVPSHLKVTLPDSISNSAKTNIFAGDWPWVDTDPVLKFFGQGNILESFLKELGIDGQGAADLCCGLVRSFLLASEPALQNTRRVLLFDEILVGLDQYRESSDINSLLEDLMSLVGLPYSGSLRNVENLPSYLEKCKQLGKKVLSQPIGSAEFREELLDRASEISPESGPKFIKSVEAFLDGLLECGDYLSDSAFVLRPALKNIRDLNLNTEISKFTYEFIKKLFQVTELESIRFKASFEPLDEQIVSSEGKKLISTTSQLSRVKVSEFSSENREGLLLAIFNRTQKLAEMPLSGGMEAIELEFSNEEIGNYKKTVNLKVKLQNSQETLFEESLKLVLVGDQRPGIILIGNDYTEYDFGDDIEHEVELPAPVGVFGNGEFYIQNDEGMLEVIKDRLLTRSAENIDPLHYYSSKAELYVGGRHSSPDIEETTVTLISNILADSQETLDQEYERLAKEGLEKKLRKLHEVFQGHKESQPINLAEIKDSVRWKANLAKQFEENNEFACFPILLNLSSQVWSSKPARGDDAAKCYIQDPSYPLCKFDQITEKSKELFSEYAAARSKIIDRIRSDTKYQSYRESHPVYSSYPTYIDGSSDDIEGLIESYVSTYCDILTRVDNLEASNTHAGQERYFLLNLDTVFFTNDSQRGLPAGIRLLGPWHPITLINRYLLQKSYYSFVNEHWFTRSNKKLAKKLSGLLGSLRSGGWISRFIATETTGREPKSKLIYQQDSGWVVSANPSLLTALSQLTEQERGDVLQEILRVTGMSLSDESEGLENSISDTLFEYTGVFSFDRRLEIDFASDYSIPQICNSMDKFTGKFNSHHGFKHSDQLIGGVHITSRANFAQLGESEVEQIRNLEDKIFLYGCKEQTEASEYDIYFAGSPKSYVDEKPSDLNCLRGNGTSALVGAQQCSLEMTNVYLGRSALVDNYDLQEGGLAISISRLNEKIASFGPDRSYFSVSEFETQGLISDDAKWIYFPARGVDPALIIKALTSTENLKALWEYKIDLFDRGDSYYLLSVFEPSVLRAIEEHLPDCAGGADQVVSTMNRLGLALNKEAHQTNKKAKGCVGLTGAARIMNLELLEELSENKSVVSYLVPVDSFDSFFGKFSITEDVSNKLTDLLLLRFHLPASSDERLGISVVGVEAKFKSGAVNDTFVRGAFDQAFASAKKMQEVIQLASQDHSLPLRILLVRLAQFCMRIRSGSANENEEISKSQKVILKKLVSGQFSHIESGKSGVVIISHADASAVTSISSEGKKGLIIRLDTNKESNDWPKSDPAEDSEKVAGVRSELFSRISGVELRPNNLTSHQEETEGAREESSNTTSVVDMESDEGEGSDRTESQPSTGTLKSTENFRIVLGESEAGHEITYSPIIGDKRISNFNMMITGSSGNGKTQFIKSLLAQFSLYDVSALVIDFKNDYSDDVDFHNRSSMEVQWVAHDGLPYNPFVPLPIPHPGTKKLQFDVSAHVIGVASALRHAYGLGPQQEAHLKDAMRAAYRNSGIPEGRINIEDVHSFPDFNQIADELDQLTRNRLDPLFALGVFREEHRNVSFSEILSKRIILDLSDVQSEDVQNALACMTIYSAHKYFNSQEHTSMLKRIFVFDEAHRVLKSPDIERLSRECRAYGVGVVLSSQKPSDFPPNVLSNLSTRIIHGNGRASEDVESIKKILGSSLSSDEIGGLSLFDAYIDNAQHSALKIKTLAYPHLIIIDSIKSSPSGLTLEEVRNIPGLDPELALDLLNQLCVRGLIYQESGRYLT